MVIGIYVLIIMQFGDSSECLNDLLAVEVLGVEIASFDSISKNLRC